MDINGMEFLDNIMFANLKKTDEKTYKMFSIFKKYGINTTTSAAILYELIALFADEK